MYKNFRNILYICIFFCFTGCAIKNNLLEISPNFNQKAFELSEDEKITLVFISKYDDEIRFIHQNLLGAPISRKILKNGYFKNDGFLPPNKKSEELFAKIIYFMNEDKKEGQIIFNNKIYGVKEIDLLK